MIEIKDMRKFEEAINEKGKLTLADFWAPWCGPCRMLGSVLDEISSETPQLNIVKVNVDEAPDIAENYSVHTLPTLILFQDGKELASKSGFISEAALLEWINNAASK